VIWLTTSERQWEKRGEEEKGRRGTCMTGIWSLHSTIRLGECKGMRISSRSFHCTSPKGEEGLVSLSFVDIPEMILESNWMEWAGRREGQEKEDLEKRIYVKGAQGFRRVDGAHETEPNHGSDLGSELRAVDIDPGQQSLSGLPPLLLRFLCLGIHYLKTFED
jgi:hypothetical protein